ncbi:hypothetical protein CTI12_AA384920 [Artemisia annua]|uniref:CCHC-type domain-containing protein n=1 Tax=Artemisia annua TaxID=35608 RepID=A0A2U1MG78_ARTAN|nr:hypothetical protein CTI12_AA384920 [Artemisia annua]
MKRMQYVYPRINMGVYTEPCPLEQRTVLQSSVSMGTEPLNFLNPPGKPGSEPHFAGYLSGKNVGEYKLCTICKKTHKGECWHDNCRNCGKSGHTSKECKAEPVCFKCKSPGHKIVDCPERKLLEYKDTQPRKTMGRVFQLTTEKA